MPGRLLIVDDEDAIRRNLRLYFERRGHEVLTAETGAAALAAVTASPPDAVVLDLRLPDVDGLEVLARMRADVPACPVILVTAHGDVETAVRAMQLGATTFLLKPVDLRALEVQVDRAVEDARLRSQVDYLRDKLTSVTGVGRRRPVRLAPAVREQIELAARSASANVLLRGETGTGKGVAARLIHDLSSRAGAEFVDVNCAGLDPEFVSSELFGHERGAFTDAKQAKRGLLEVAHRGSVFLDEVATLAPELQSRLLKVIDEKRFRRLGGTTNIEVDVRVFAATNEDLERYARGGRFRRDLLFRLNVVAIELPPLRGRDEQILTLAGDFLADFCAAEGRPPARLAPEAESLLVRYSWPGNIRELRNVIERAVLLCRDDRVGPQHLPAGLRERAPAAATPTEGSLALADVERAHILRVVELCQGNRSKAARLLGIHRTTLLEKLARYGLT